MYFKPVVSSNLLAVAYDEQSRTLGIKFHSGTTYFYYGVPPSIYSGLMAAASKGTFHAHFIKESYPYRRVS